MSSNIKHANSDPLEQMLKETFDQYTVPETTNSWIKIKKQVFKKHFFKLKPFQFNIYYATVLTISGLLTGFLYFSEKEVNTQVISDDEKIGEKEILVPTLNTKPTPTNEIKPKYNVEAVTESINSGSIESENRKVDDQTSGLNPESKPNNTLVTKENIDSTDFFVNSAQEETDKMESQVDHKNLLESKVEKDTIVNLINQLEKEPIIVPIIVDSLNDTQLEDDSVKGELIKEKEPVVKIDTIIKVIRKRKKRKDRN